MIELAAEVADFVVALTKADGNVEIAVADDRHLLLEFDHGALDEICQHADGYSADDDSSSSSKQKQGVAIVFAQCDSGDGKEQQSRQ